MARSAVQYAMASLEPAYPDATLEQLERGGRFTVNLSADPEKSMRLQGDPEVLRAK
jgi:hypothetical protein